MMAWNVTDYTLKNMKSKSNKEINQEYNRIKNVVKKRVQTFEKHGKGNIPQVKAVKTALTGNDSRRMRERAIMDMQRFLYMPNASYRQYHKSLMASINHWNAWIKGMDFSENEDVEQFLITEENADKFFDFLEWAKGFYNSKYSHSGITKAWKDIVTQMQRDNIEGAYDIFTHMEDYV